MASPIVVTDDQKPQVTRARVEITYSPAPWDMIHDATASACTALILYPPLESKMKLVRVEQKDSIRRQCFAQVKICKDTCPCMGLYMCFFVMNSAVPVSADISPSHSTAAPTSAMPTTTPAAVSVTNPTELDPGMVNFENHLVEFLIQAPFQECSRKLAVSVRGPVVLEMMSMRPVQPYDESWESVGESKARVASATAGDEHVLQRVDLDTDTFKLLEVVRMQLLCNKIYGLHSCPHPPGFHKLMTQE